MTQSNDINKLSKNEYYKCPLPHTYPRHEQAFFRNFDSHFSIFRDRDDHFPVVSLHEELMWNIRRSESEKGNLNEQDLRKLSFKAWLDAIKQCSGKAVQVVVKK
jgi:hypothetical protein